MSIVLMILKTCLPNASYTGVYFSEADVQPINHGFCNKSAFLCVPRLFYYIVNATKGVAPATRGLPRWVDGLCPVRCLKNDNKYNSK